MKRGNLFDQPDNQSQQQFHYQNPEPEIDKKKVAVVSIIGIVLLVGLYFLISQGILAGKAIYMVDTMSHQEFVSLVEGTIYDRFAKTTFYPSMPPVEFCVQVPKNSIESASFRVIKSYSIFKVKETVIPCDENQNYDFVIKFTSYEAFEDLATDLTCEKMQEVHQNKGMFVLPSKYVVTGFKTDPAKDYSKFCSVLSQCLSQLELNLLGIGC